MWSPQSRGEGVHRRCEQGSRAFPKGKVQASRIPKGKSRSKSRSIPSIRAELAMLATAQDTELSVSRSILVQFAPKLAGSSGRTIFHRLVFFSYFFRTFFRSHFSNPTINQCLCKVINIYFANMGGGTTRRPIPKVPMAGEAISHAKLSPK